MNDDSHPQPRSNNAAEAFTEKEIASLIAQSATPVFTSAHYFGRSGISVKTAVLIARDLVAQSISHATVESCKRLSKGEGTPVDLKTEVLDKVNALAATIERESSERRAAIEEGMMKRVLDAKSVVN
jgi:hypothetical protein